MRFVRAVAGALSRNVASIVEAPHVKHREVEILSPTHVRTVLDALQGKPLHTIATLLLGTGLRRGEALALRWQDIDLDGGTLRVEQALAERRNVAVANSIHQRTNTADAL